MGDKALDCSQRNREHELQTLLDSSGSQIVGGKLELLGRCCTSLSVYENEGMSRLGKSC